MILANISIFRVETRVIIGARCLFFLKKIFENVNHFSPAFENPIKSIVRFAELWVLWNPQPESQRIRFKRFLEKILVRGQKSE